MARPQTTRSIVGRAAGLFIAALVLSGCVSSGGLTGAGEDDGINPAANIESLTQVIQRNPRNAHALNVRGTAFANAGRLNEALRRSRSIQATCRR